MTKYEKQLKPWLEGCRPFTATEIRNAGIPSQILVELCSQGIIERLYRGIYLPCQASPTAELSEQVVSLKMPNAVLCLLTALRFHNFTTQLPHEVWIARKPGTWIPQANIPPIRVVTLSGASYNYGIEEHDVGGMTLKVYSAAKTVADCFKFRNKIGIDVALEALQDGLRQELFTADEISRAAKACRVYKVMYPYLETLYA
jgi:predicted transcriptional regulator of viral defense system